MVSAHQMQMTWRRESAAELLYKEMDGLGPYSRPATGALTASAVSSLFLPFCAAIIRLSASLIDNFC